MWKELSSVSYVAESAFRHTRIKISCIQKKMVIRVWVRWYNDRSSEAKNCTDTNLNVLDLCCFVSTLIALQWYCGPTKVLRYLPVRTESSAGFGIHLLVTPAWWVSCHVPPSPVVWVRECSTSINIVIPERPPCFEFIKSGRYCLRVSNLPLYQPRSSLDNCTFCEGVHELH